MTPRGSGGGDVLFYPDGSWNLDAIQSWPIDLMHQFAVGLRPKEPKTHEQRVANVRPHLTLHLDGVKDLKTESVKVAHGYSAVLRSYWKMPEVGWETTPTARRNVVLMKCFTQEDIDDVADAVNAAVAGGAQVFWG